jgi:Transmembrane secretion effector
MRMNRFWSTGCVSGAPASHRGAWQDASDPSRILEQFVVASRDEHLRQHERVTRRDRGRLDRIREMTDPARPVTVMHWLTVSKRKPVRDRGPADTVSQVDAHAGSRQTIRSVVGS